MRTRLAIAAGAVLAAALSGARADTFSGFAEGGYTHSNAENRDPSGAASTFTNDLLYQRYRLGIEKPLVPTLRFSGTGFFERDIAWGSGFTSASNVWNATADLIWSLPTITTAAGYNRRQVGRLVADDYHVILGWRPLDLPTFSLRVSRPQNYDLDRRFTDIRSHEVALASQWMPVRRLSLTYAFLYSDPEDRIHHSEAVSTSHNAAASYTGSIVPRLFDYSLGATFSRLDIDATASSRGGSVETLQTPIAGFSAIETPPATRTFVAVQPNQLLVNGDKTVSAGINLGTSRPLANDPYYRDLAVQFGDIVTPVNTFYVWVDRDVSEVAPLIPFTAYSSDDGQHWTELGIIQQLFSGFANRFEITIVTTRARFLKVTAAPLNAAATTRDVYRDIFVTELQEALVEALPGGHVRTLNNTTSFSAGARSQLIPDLLAFDSSFNVRNTTRPAIQSLTTWYLLNGLNLNKQLNDFTLFSARAARQDSDQLRGHEVQYLWGSSVAVNELPTLGHSLNYTGSANYTAFGNALNNALIFSTTAVPYRGINLGAVASYSVGETVSGQNTSAATLSFDSTVQPHPMLQVHGAFTHNDLVASGGGLPRSASAVNTLEAAATFRPARVFFVTATVARVITPPRAVTLWNGILGLNATAGGDLQLSVTFNSVLDVDGSITRFFTPSARWNIRRDVVLTTSYTMTDGDRGGGEQHQRAFTIDLRIAL